MKITRYTLKAPLQKPLMLALVADLHNGRYEGLLSALTSASPDAVCVVGDFLDRREKVARGFSFLAASAQKWPPFVSLGNHEMKAGMPRAALAARIRETGAQLLDNESTRLGELTLGGLSSGYAPADKQSKWKPAPTPDLAFLDAFSAIPGAKVLLCHHPEYYDPLLASRHTGVVLSGHAHGGQWRIFGRGVFAPGQGLFPRYTAGLYHGRLLVSRGLCQTNRFIPRICNPRELMMVTLSPE